MPPVAKKRPINSVAAARGRPQRARASNARWLWESLKSLFGAIAIFLLIRTFLVEAFRIPSGSMIPTLLVGDWLFVNKLVYGPHIPFTHVSLPGYADPKRGEVIVFESPYQADLAAVGDDATPTLVKRMVGMAGDTLYMRQGLLYVNGMPQRQGYAASANEPVAPEAANEVSELFDWQKKVGLAASRFGPAPAQPMHDNWGPFVVPAKHYFMMGDNRYQSKDSRYWSFVPRANVRGRPIFVYYSYDTETGVDFFRAITEIRWSRIGTRIK